MMFTMDFAALGKREDIKFHQKWTFSPAFYTLAFGFAALVGIFLTFTIPGITLSESGVAGGLVGMMGLLGLLVVWSTQTRINTANYYLGAANLRQFCQVALHIKIPNVAWVIISSVIIFFIMLLPVVQYIVLMLAWQGVIVTAWVAIALTHILLDRWQNQEHSAIADQRYKQINKSGLIAWIVSTVIGLLMLQLGSIAPDLAGIGATWGPILTALSSSLIYAVMWKVAPRHRTALRLAG